MSNRNDLFVRHGNDEEGHYFEPQSQANAGQSAGGGAGKLFLFCAALFVLVFLLRNSYRPEATHVVTTYTPGINWPQVWAWVGGIVGGIAGVIFLVYQTAAAWRDREGYWMLRLARTGFKHGHRSAGAAWSLVRSAGGFAWVLLGFGWAGLSTAGGWTMQQIKRQRFAGALPALEPSTGGAQPKRRESEDQHSFDWSPLELEQLKAEQEVRAIEIALLLQEAKSGVSPERNQALKAKIENGFNLN